MSCMKCGKDTDDGQLFCAGCLEKMEAYPVKPDVHIQLPNRSVEGQGKKQPRKERSVPKEVQISVLRRQNRWLWVVILALLLALVVSNTRSFRSAIKSKISDIGRNYTQTDPTK